MSNPLATFSDRLRWVLADRSPSSWCESLGIGTGGALVRMFNDDGIPPKADRLAVIAAHENLNLHWLLTGEGNPFRTEAMAEAPNLLATIHLLAPSPKDWVGVVLHDDYRAALALLRQHVPSADGERPEWMELRLFTRLQPSDLRDLIEKSALHSIRGIDLHGGIVDDIEAGRAGTWRIFRTHQRAEAIKRAHLVHTVSDVFRYESSVRESPASPPYTADPDERDLIAAWRRLTPEERTAFKLVLGPFLTRKP